MNANEKLRNALKLCVEQMCDRCRAAAELDGLQVPCVVGCETLRMAKEALDEPLRNCDVGTVKDKYDRFKLWCLAGNNTDCENVCCIDRTMKCLLGWAKMPYESEAKDAE